MTTTVRRARPDDATTLGAIHVRSWQRGYDGLLPADVLADLDPVARGQWWAQLLQAQDGTPDDTPGPVTHVAERGGAVVGFVGTGPVRGSDHGESASTAELFLYVDPEAWRGGVGRELMATATARLTRAGYTDAMLWVLEGNARAIGFYEATGWEHDGVRRVEVIPGVTAAELGYRRQLG
ncbi:GNAT family N-acetyltransferase [Litorihabitans aurantiacus]|uniref:N-acetyltransferase n=1 Tax=Litorihabitans aurantiacus TaxID=1930061 RepID=A0AA37XHU5_9MICO|nr:GNAT family N-acetyltransferase [Litorihabitans aurantiacus]GMA32855.1 N-acetyltransferase [Litorihabitans aurantiacus]